MKFEIIAMYKLCVECFVEGFVESMLVDSCGLHEILTKGCCMTLHGADGRSVIFLRIELTNLGEPLVD